MPFSIVNRGEGWFWCSLLEVPRDALIGPFPSQIEAEKDARATLGIEEGTPGSEPSVERVGAERRGQGPSELCIGPTGR